MANLSIDRWAKEVGASLDESARAIKLEVFTGVIDDTRVDTGRLKGNWQTTNNNPASGTTEREDKEGNAVKDEAAETVTAFGVDYLTNNLDYAMTWEERDGMVARNLARVETIVRGTKK